MVYDLKKNKYKSSLRQIMKLHPFKLLVLVFPLLVLDACSTNPVTGKKDFMLMSKEQEIAMGQESDPGITAFFGLYNDQQLQNFIDKKGQEMVDVSHRQDLKYEFKIVDSPVVNAFAVPGGYVYFTRGIMAHFNNEAEFAGVLGHEIGHIAARHSAKQYSKAMAAQLGLVVGSIVSEDFRQFAGLAQTGVSLLFLKFGRDAERQSDKLGAEYSTRVGYDAHQMAGFFNTLQRQQEQSGQMVPAFLSTHPDPGDRYVAVNKEADKWQRKLDPSNLEVNRDSYLKMIDGIVYGEDPRQGYVENQMFYHPVMKFQYPVPGGWQVQNTPQAVQMVPENGEAIMMLTLATENSLDAAAEGVLKNFQLSLVESERMDINGYSAIGMVADQQQENQSLRTLVYVIQGDNQIYNFIGATSAAQFNQYLNIFKSSMGEFRRLTDQSKINVQPKRIKIETVRRTGTLENTLRQLGASNEQLNELAILNGMELNDQVKEGMLIKTINY